MVLITNNTRLWLIGMAVSVAIFLGVYFLVIKPNDNTANQAVKAGLQQTHQALNQAQQQLNSAAGQAGAAAAPAQQALSKAQKLTACLTSAGTDAAAMQSCQAKFGN
jgi:type II secretory pathway component PulM